MRAVALRLHRPTIRARLTLIVITLVIPGWLGLAVTLYGCYRFEREQIALGTVATARALMAAVDRELEDTIAVARLLASSPSLSSDDFASFHREASKLLPIMFGTNFVLSDASGQQLVNTLQPYGQPLPHQVTPRDRRVFETGQPVISDVFVGPVAKKPLISVEVPVLRDGRIPYKVMVGVLPENWDRLLSRQKLSPTWVASIFDTTHATVARNPNSESFIGRPASPQLLTAMQNSREGVVEADTREGIRVYAAYSRSQISNWTIAIGIPIAELSSGLNTLLMIGAAGAVILLAIGLTLSGYQAAQISGAVRSLIPPALALGRGEVPKISRLRVHEANELGRALNRAYQLLQNRTAERDSANEKKAAAETAARVMDEFVTTVSHELRTPLTSIAASLRLLASGTGAALQPAAVRLLTIANDNTQRLVRLVNDILDIAALESGQSAFKPGPVDLCAVARDAVEASSAFAESRGVSIRLEAAAPACVVSADADRLMQVVVNLLSNAVKFSPTGERVTVRIEQHAGTGRIVVRDHGPGIPETFRSRIFQKFAQADAKDTRDKGGTGLGLSIVQKIVSQHGGTVSFETATGGGTAFTVEIPLWTRATRAA